MCWENEVLLSSGGWGQRCGATVDWVVTEEVMVEWRLER